VWESTSHSIQQDLDGWLTGQEDKEVVDVDQREEPQGSSKLEAHAKKRCGAGRLQVKSA
jgi:hypothetical protein